MIETLLIIDAKECKEEDREYQCWTNKCFSAEMSETSSQTSDEENVNNEIISSLLSASSIGDASAVIFSLKRQNEIQMLTSDGKNALHLASQNDHGSICHILIQAGIDVESRDSGGFTPLHLACREGHRDTVKTIIQHNADVNIRTKTGLTPLGLACLGGYHLIVSDLIDAGADINMKDYDGRSLINLSAVSGHLDVVKKLLTLFPNIDLSIADNSGCTALHKASQQGNAFVVQSILDYQENIKNFKNKNGDTALNIACYRGHIDVVIKLLNVDADVNIADYNGATPLHNASVLGHLNCILLLLAHLKNTMNEQQRMALINLKNNYGRTALRIASFNGHNQVVQKLLLVGADANLSDNNGSSPLHGAAKQGHVDVLQTLLQHDIKLINMKNSTGNTALIIASYKGKAESVNHLLAAGADVAITNTNGSTALHSAAERGRLNVVRLLLLHNRNIINAINMYGDTALHRASMNGHNEVISELLLVGADTTIKNNHENTPLHNSSLKGHIEVVKTLLNHDVKAVDALNAYKETAINKASCKGHYDIVLELLKAGANPSLPDNFGCTPLHNAAENGHIKVVEILLNHNKDIIDIKNTKGETALNRSSFTGVYEVVKKLVSSGADVNAADNYGFTPLHNASLEGRADIVKLLITNGANKKLKNKYKKKAIDIANGLYSNISVIKSILK